MSGIVTEKYWTLKMKTDYLYWILLGLVMGIFLGVSIGFYICDAPINGTCQQTETTIIWDETKLD